MRRIALCGMILLLTLTACDGLMTSTNSSDSGNYNNSDSGGYNTGDTSGGGEIARVVRVIDGDTIDVDINGTTMRVRYVGMNTPERNEPCYQDATDANSRLVSGQTVRLVKDTSETDIYGRLLRYVYVGDTFVNRELVKEGWAEVVLYPPDGRYFDEFKQLEIQAAAANIGCHPTGIFNDGSYTR